MCGRRSDVAHRVSDLHRPTMAMGGAKMTAACVDRAAMQCKGRIDSASTNRSSAFVGTFANKIKMMGACVMPPVGGGAVVSVSGEKNGPPMECRE